MIEFEKIVDGKWTAQVEFGKPKSPEPGHGYILILRIHVLQSGKFDGTIEGFSHFHFNAYDTFDKLKDRMIAVVREMFKSGLKAVTDDEE